MKQFEWNVFYHNFNSRKIEQFNIFNHGRFANDVKKDLKKCETKDEFAEKLKRNLFYYFGSKFEWETVVTTLPSYINKDEYIRLMKNKDEKDVDYVRNCIAVDLDVERKIDVYEQCMLNFDVLVNYVWEGGW